MNQITTWENTDILGRKKGAKDHSGFFKKSNIKSVKQI